LLSAPDDTKTYPLQRANMLARSSAIYRVISNWQSPSCDILHAVYTR